MHRSIQRTLTGSAAVLAALSMSAGVAYAGEDEDDDGGEAVTAPAPSTESSSGGGDTGSVAGAPQGGVATGAGGTAPTGPDVLLLGLASGAVVLLASGGRLVAGVRREPS